MRRLLLAALVTAIAASLAVPVDASTKPPAKKPAVARCPTITDPAKDDAFPVAGTFEDPALDIVGTTYLSDKATVSVVVKVAKLGPPTYADGAQYSGGFLLGAKPINLFGTSSQTQPATDPAFALKGIQVDGTYVSGTEAAVTMTLNPAKNTVTLTAKLNDISAAAGRKAQGPVRGLFSNISATYGILLESYDDAAGPGTLLLGGCKP